MQKRACSLTPPSMRATFRRCLTKPTARAWACRGSSSSHVMAFPPRSLFPGRRAAVAGDGRGHSCSRARGRQPPSHAPVAAPDDGVRADRGSRVGASGATRARRRRARSRSSPGGCGSVASNERLRRPGAENDAMPCRTRIAAVPDDVEPVVSERSRAEGHKHIRRARWPPPHPRATASTPLRSI